jgi:hypothetical protein
MPCFLANYELFKQKSKDRSKGENSSNLVTPQSDTLYATFSGSYISLQRGVEPELIGNQWRVFKLTCKH